MSGDREPARAADRGLIALFEQAPGLISIHEGPDHVITFVNAALRAITPAGIVGRPYREALPQLAAQGFGELMDRVYRTGEPAFGLETPLAVPRMDLRAPSNDVTGGDPTDAGLERRAFNFVWQPLRDRAGAVMGVMTHAVDVTALVAARERAKAAGVRLRGVIEGVDAIVMELPTAAEAAAPAGAAAAGFDDLVFVSQRAEVLLGVPATELLRGATWAALLHPDDVAALAAARRGLTRHGEAYEVELRIHTSSGEPRVLLERGQRWAEGREPLHLALAVDVTDDRRSAGERLRLAEQLQEAQRLESLGLLASGIAHDFNNLLTAVLANASLAQRALPPGSTARDDLDAAMDAARRAAELTRQLLAYAGRGRFDVRRLDVAAEASALAPLLERAIPKSVRLTIERGSGDAGCELDAVQLQQVLLNLVINAGEAIGRGQGRVVVRARVATLPAALPAEVGQTRARTSPLAPGTYAVLEVEDDGPGVPAGVLARMFEPFASTKGDGRGLGLAAVAGIARAAAGAVEVETHPGAGARFRVWLPASAPPSAAVASAEPTRAPATAHHGQALVIEDELVVRRTTRKLLERAGFTVVEAKDGREGLAVFTALAAQLRLVVLDVTMPEVPGEEVFRTIRAQAPALPVLLVSGFHEFEALAADEPRGGGAVSFLRKPFTPAELLEHLDRLLA